MRKKSRAERKRATLFISFALTGVVALVWATVVFPRTVLLNDEAEAAKADVVTPFKTLVADMGIIVGDLKRGVAKVRKEAQELFGGDVEAASQADEVGGEGEEADPLIFETGSRGAVETSPNSGIIHESYE